MKAKAKVHSKQLPVFGTTHCENLIGDLHYTGKADLKRQLTKLADLMHDDVSPGSLYLCGLIKVECQNPGECDFGKRPSISGQVFQQFPDDRNA